MLNVERRTSETVNPPQNSDEIDEHHLDEISETSTLTPYSTTISSRLKLTFKIIYLTFILIRRLLMKFLES